MPASNRARARLLSALALLGIGAHSDLTRVALAQSSELSPRAAPAARRASPLSETLTGGAKLDYDLGRLLYDNGDFAGALVRFDNARQASGDARLLWNAAVCEKALRHYAKAAALMRGFLATASELTSEEARARARDFAIAAESLTGLLLVTANVAGAELYVNSERLAQLPLKEPVRVDWGAHQLVVSRPGYISYSQGINVDGSPVIRVAAVLRPIVHEGRIIVRAAPDQSIWVDGRRVGWGNWEGALASGQHWLRVRADGFNPYERQILVTDDLTQGFDVALERGTRSLLPGWVWLVAGSVLAAGSVTAGYFVFKSEPARRPTPGSIATIQLELR